ncbi:MAG: tetratricopeptide repeat protein [Desulfovibrio sp.]
MRETKPMPHDHNPKEDAMRTATTTLIILMLLSALAGCAPRSLDETSTLADLARPEAQGGPELSPDQHLRLGERLASEGNGEAAFLHYQQALAELERTGAPQDDPRWLALRTHKGLLLLAQGQNEAALSEFQAVLALCPDHAGANEGAGAVYLRTGLVQDARAHLERALARDPDLWRAHQFLGVLESRQGNTERSVEELSASLALAPNNPGTLNNLGVTLLMRQEYGPALDAFRKALLAGAPKARTYNNIGLTLARMGHRQEALEAFKYAGSEASAYNNLGYVLLLRGEVDDATACFEKAVELSPSYYAKAFENLKQARMARGFLATGLAAGLAPASSAAEPEPVSAPQASPRPAVIPEKHTETNTERSAPPSTRELREMAPSSKPTLLRSTSPDTVLPVVSAFSPALTLRHAEPAAPLVSTASARTASSRAVRTNASPDDSIRIWGFHLASFKQRGTAEAEAANIAAQRGLETSVARVDLETKGVWYRVLAGRFPSREQARAMRARVAEQLRLPNTEELIITSFVEPDRAIPPARPAL